MSNLCLNCGEKNPINYSNKDNKFCTDKCRDDYHNDLRKASRAIKAIMARTEIIHEIGKNPHKAMEIRTMLRKAGLTNLPKLREENES